MKFILLTLFLYYIRLTSVEVAGDGRPPSNCCITVNKTKVPIKKLLDYDIQNSPPCPIKAIRFRTIKNIRICSDPEDDWAKKAKTALDKKPQPVEEHFVCTISTTTRSPTTTTLINTTQHNTTTQPETVTSTSTVTSISTVTSTVTTFKTKTWTTDTKPATVPTKSSQSPLTSTNPCTTQPTRDRVTNTAVLITTSIKTSNTRKILPKSIQRKRGKSRNGLRKYQMKTKNKDKSTRQV